MASASETKLTIPIQGIHITEALVEARAEEESFRGNEMTWLKEHNPLLWVQTNALFEKVIKQESPTEAEASVAGRLLGNRSVRLAVGDSGYGYMHASLNYQRNRESYINRPERHGSMPQRAWDNSIILLEVFGDLSVVSALMRINHDVSRHAAAVAIGYFCLAEVPASS